MNVLLGLLVSTSAALILTPLVRTLGLKLGIVDQPGKRKVHQRPMVRLGGVAICAATLIGFGLSSGFVPSSEWSTIAALLLGGLGFFSIGLADDILNLPALLRLGLQAVVAALVWSLGIRVEVLPIPLLGAVDLGWFSLPITFLWLAGVANAINWIDGLDGLAGGVTTIAAGLLAITCWPAHPPVALLSLSLMGGALGFLRYNASPAQIFMGDGGSYFIGFMLASLGTVGLMSEQTFTHALLPYGILAVPILDMTYVIVSRLLEGKSPFTADQRHLHHRFLKLGLSKEATVRIIHGLTLWLGSWMLPIVHVPYSSLIVSGTTLLLLIALTPIWQRVLVFKYLTSEPAK